MVDHQHGFQFRSSGSKRIHLGSRCCTNLMPGRYLRLVVLQEILRGAGCCVFLLQLSVLQLKGWTVLSESFMLSCFLFLVVFACLCFQSEGVAINELWGVTVSCSSSTLSGTVAPHQPPIQEKHLSKEAGTIDWVRLFEYNTGLSTPLRWELMTGGSRSLSQLSFMAAIRNSQGIHLWRLRIHFRNIFQFQVHSTLFCCFPFLWSIEYSLVLQTYYRRL